MISEPSLNSVACGLVEALGMTDEDVVRAHEGIFVHGKKIGDWDAEWEGLNPFIVLHSSARAIDVGQKNTHRTVENFDRTSARFAQELPPAWIGRSQEDSWAEIMRDWTIFEET